MTYPVKYMTSEFAGAPRMSGTAGDMIALLDACLINGFNVLAVSSLSVTSEVATADFGTAHGYIAGQIVLIDGVTDLTGLNGEQYVASVTGTGITFTATGVADGSASGTIGCRTAPVGGWEKAYSGTNKAVYRSTDPTGTQMCLRVDDTNAQYSICRGYESMSDVDTGSGEFPTPAQYTYGYVWKKSNYTSTASVPWVLIGDARMFYLIALWHSSYPTLGAAYWFGDIETSKAGDGYHCVIGGHKGTTTSPSSPGTNNSFSRVDGTTSNSHIARSYTQIGSSVEAFCVSSGFSVRMGYQGAVYPSPVDNSLMLHAPVCLCESSLTARGVMPGVLQPIQDKPLAHGDVVSDISSLPGRRVLMTAGAEATNEARYAFDITGPWR